MKSIRAKLIVLMILICCIGMLLVATISTLISRNTLLEETQSKISQTTAREATRIDGWLERQTDYVLALSIDLSFEDDYSKEHILPILNKHVDSSERYFDVYMGFADGTVTFASGFTPDYASGWSSVKRPWYIGAMLDTTKPFITEPYTDVQTGELCITASKAVIKDGEVVGVAATDILITTLKDIVDSTNVGENSYAFLLDAQDGVLIYPGNLYRPDEEEKFQNLSDVEDGFYAPVLEKTAADGEFARAADLDKVERYYTAHTIGTTGWRLYTAVPVKVLQKSIYSLIRINIIIFFVVVAAAFLLIFTVVSRVIVRPIAQVTNAAKVLTSGSTNIAIDYNEKDEIGSLVDSFTTMAESIRAQANVTRTIADGDLTAQVPVRSEEDVMGQALGDLSEKLGESITAISRSSKAVADCSDKINQTSAQLSQGAADQAQAMDVLSSSISNITDNISASREKTTETNTVSSDIAQKAQEGADQMSRMISAVKEISAASSNIAGVIKVIDGIAFQTNILALNAAVEAARAGEHGKGFAVVADEVRTLASNSATAAKETTALIQNSVERADEGVQIAQETSESLQSILEGVKKTAALTGEISAFTLQQDEAIRQINHSIDLVSQVMQSSMNSSEENKEIARQLYIASQQLVGVVRRFKTDAGGEGEEYASALSYDAFAASPAFDDEMAW